MILRSAGMAGRPGRRPGGAAAVPPLATRGLVATVDGPTKQWLAPWEPTPPGPWSELNSPASFRYVLPRTAPGRARPASGMPFAVCLRTGRGEDWSVR